MKLPLVNHTTKNEVVTWHRNAVIDFAVESKLSEDAESSEETEATAAMEVMQATIKDLASLVANLEKYYTAAAPKSVADIEPETR